MDTRSSSCVFCEIVAGRAPAHRIAENEKALAILDIHPFSAGHTLVLSKRHVPFWHELTEEEAARLFALAHRVARRLSKTFDPEFVCLMARGRRISHTHVFLVPTRPGDVLDRHFNGLEKVQEGAEELAHLREHASRESAARGIRRRSKVRGRRSKVRESDPASRESDALTPHRGTAAAGAKCLRGIRGAIEPHPAESLTGAPKAQILR